MSIQLVYRHALTWIWQGHASTNHSMIFLWVSGIKGIGTQSGEKKLVVVVVQESGRSGRSGSDMATKTQP